MSELIREYLKTHAVTVCPPRYAAGASHDPVPRFVPITGVSRNKKVLL